MRRRVAKFTAVLASVLLAGTVLGAATTVASSPPQVSLDPNLPIHPLLQYGAQVEPNKRVKVIVKRSADSLNQQDQDNDNDVREDEKFSFVSSKVLELPQRSVYALARKPGVLYITPDAAVRGTSVDPSQLKTTYEASANVISAWNGSLPVTGMGVTVAVIDSGLNNQLADFNSLDVNCYNANVQSIDCTDQNGHGTHVAGIIRGIDPLGRYIGVAPGAHLLSIKIADNTGASTESDLVRGLQWVFDNRTSNSIKVVNLSLAASVPYPYMSSPISAAVEQLWLNGVTVVAAAGNNGTAPNATSYAPGNDPFAITVGALDDNMTSALSDDSLAPFSSRGLTQDGYYKPDVVAPGRYIVSSLAGPTSTLATQLPDRIVDKNYIRLSGTSMAAPVVSGIVALALERFPNLTPNQLKWLLVNSARTYPGQPDGAGAVDALRALQVAASGSVGQANQGLVPNTLLSPVTNTVVGGQTYWNQTYWSQTYWNQTYWSQTYWN